MGFFGFGRKDKVIDLSEGYRRRQEKESQPVKAKEEPTDTFSFLGNASSSSSSTNSDTGDYSDSDEDKKKKLAKRLLDMTNKLDEISTQIYHLQQRVELLERKTGVRAGID